MKKTLLMAAAGLMAAMTFAAQCQGVTKTGERCKRDAAEGSKYCLGHADQAKNATQEKDDGTCWAITAAGARCKNHKDGEKDYCKLHAADKRVKVSPARCRALTWEGTRCTRAPEPSYNYCKQHGAPAAK